MSVLLGVELDQKGAEIYHAIRRELRLPYNNKVKVVEGFVESLTPQREVRRKTDGFCPEIARMAVEDATTWGEATTFYAKQVNQLFTTQRFAILCSRHGIYLQEG